MKPMRQHTKQRPPHNASFLRKQESRTTLNATPTKRCSGFTLAELIVATTIITIVMTAVYTAFSSTLRVRRMSETGMHGYQDARIALNIMKRELNCVLPGSNYLFQGDDDEFEFFAVVPPMNIELGKGPRVMWIQYRFNRSKNILERKEAALKKPLPQKKPDEDDLEHPPDLDSKETFEFAVNVESFDVEYYWMPEPEREKDEPPQYIEPVILKENPLGWGLPRAVKVSLKITDPHGETRERRRDEPETTFNQMVAFQIQTDKYDPERLGLAEAVE